MLYKKSFIYSPYDTQIVATMSPIMYVSLTFAITCWNAADVARISLILLVYKNGWHSIRLFGFVIKNALVSIWFDVVDRSSGEVEFILKCKLKKDKMKTNERSMEEITQCHGF